MGFIALLVATDIYSNQNLRNYNLIVDSSFSSTPGLIMDVSTRLGQFEIA
jgi:hypothetical protein